MKSKHAFALIALLLGIVGGVLLLRGFIDFASRLLEGSRHLSSESLLLAAIGVIAIVGSVMVWTGRYFAGGLINIICGLVGVFYGRDTEGLLILISGILGIVAPRIRD